MSHPFTKDCNWRRSIGGWGQRTKWFWFSESTCRIWGGNGFAAKHSITRNYNNSTLEDGLFHFIMRFALSCLIRGGWGGSVPKQRQWLCETDTWSLILNAFILSICAPLPFISILTFQSLAWPATEVTNLKYWVGVNINGCRFAGAPTRNSKNKTFEAAESKTALWTWIEVKKTLHPSFPMMHFSDNGPSLFPKSQFLSHNFRFFWLHELFVNSKNVLLLWSRYFLTIRRTFNEAYYNWSNPGQSWKKRFYSLTRSLYLEKRGKNGP